LAAIVSRASTCSASLSKLSARASNRIRLSRNRVSNASARSIAAWFRYSPTRDGSTGILVIARTRHTSPAAPTAALMDRFRQCDGPPHLLVKPRSVSRAKRKPRRRQRAGCRCWGCAPGDRYGCNRYERIPHRLPPVFGEGSAARLGRQKGPDLGSGSVSTKLWSLTDIVRVIENWEAADAAKLGDRIIGEWV
jgi:hypothetical protein